MTEDHENPELLNELMPLEHAHVFNKSEALTNKDTHFVLDELNRAFESFKQANDERLEEMEKRQTADVVTTQKVNRLEQTISSLSQDLNRPRLSQKFEGTSEKGHQTAAFGAYLKTGDASAMHALEQRAFNVTSKPDGGYLVPQSLDKNISTVMESVSVLRKFASVVHISSGTTYRKLHQNGHMGAAWVSETSDRDMTDTAQFNELTIPVHELHACPAATSVLINDAAIDIEDWFFKAINMTFGAKESEAFILGNTGNSPKGILSYDEEVNGTGTWNKLSVIKSGNATGLPASNPENKLIDLVYHLGTHYRQKAHWLMNQSTMAALRKLRTSDKSYIWSPPSAHDQLPSVLGFPVLEDANMPDIQAGKVPILFGDFKSAYVIVDNMGTQVLRDPYSKKPYVLFYTVRRIGGGIQDFAALRGLKIAA